MEWEWDPAKARRNLRKHGVDFADSIEALLDPLALTIPDPDTQEEERRVGLGIDAFERLLVVVYTRRGGRIRIISARRATRRERRRYEES